MNREILVIEDQLGIRLLLMDVFTNNGYQVTVTKTGQEGLEKLCDQSFDLLILDYHLPLMNGLEILQEMKRNQINIPVILISGFIEGIKKDEFPNFVTIKWLAKPFNIQEVYGMVQEILKR